MILHKSAISFLTKIDEKSIWIFIDIIKRNYQICLDAAMSLTTYTFPSKMYEIFKISVPSSHLSIV